MNAADQERFDVTQHLILAIANYYEADPRNITATTNGSEYIQNRREAEDIIRSMECQLHICIISSDTRELESLLLNSTLDKAVDIFIDGLNYPFDTAAMEAIRRSLKRAFLAKDTTLTDMADITDIPARPRLLGKITDAIAENFPMKLGRLEATFAAAETLGDVIRIYRRIYKNRSSLTLLATQPDKGKKRRDSRMQELFGAPRERKTLHAGTFNKNKRQMVLALT